MLNNILDVLLDYNDVITTIIPELAPCVGFEQNNKYHQYTVYDHIAHAVSNYKGDDVCTLVALLLHDIGKPLCYTEDENGGHFYGHGIPSFSIAEQVLERLRFDNKSQHDIAELVLYHDSTIEPTPRTVRRWLNKVGEVQFRRLMDIRLADILAHKEGTTESRIQRRNDALALAEEIIASNQCFTVKNLAINGNDVMQDGIPEGRMVGAALNAALDAVISGVVENQKDILLDVVHDFFSYVREGIDTRDAEPFCPFGLEDMYYETSTTTAASNWWFRNPTTSYTVSSNSYWPVGAYPEYIFRDDLVLLGEEDYTEEPEPCTEEELEEFVKSCGS